MKSYLSLIPISAKVHRRQNRMTLLCIIFSVFLVTAVFSMADMGVRMETARLLSKHSEQALQEMQKSPAAQPLYVTAYILFGLILIAGVLMISSSINSNVAQRTKFFGMMRCIGMSKQQIIHFVRLEALNWCKIGIPIGTVLGIVVTWVLCAALRFGVANEFSTITLWGISPIGICSGVILGIITVLIAAGTPAKRASAVSPISAVSGNEQGEGSAHGTVNVQSMKIQISLGIHHAVAVKKNLLLMTGSFALSIILFLCFSVLINFVNCLVPQASDQADIEIASNDTSNSIDPSLLDTISRMAGVKQVFGRKSLLGYQAKVGEGKAQVNAVDLIAYDKFDLDCLTKDKMLRKKSDVSKVYGNSDYVLTIWDKDDPLQLGNKLRIGDKEVEIAGQLRYNPFTQDGSTDGKVTIIASPETFTRITGISDYSLVIVQLTKNATDEDVAAIQKAIGNRYVFMDQREMNTSRTYMAFKIFVYGFLIIIALVAVLNIMNNISMSVSARMKQYGIMRAVGMDKNQISQMIAAEAFTYALSGFTVGCMAGLLLSKLLYDKLITPHFVYATWEVPVTLLVIIFMVIFLATVAAVYRPSKRIRNMVITDTINEL